jgi:hypothetical protein
MTQKVSRSKDTSVHRLTKQLLRLCSNKYNRSSSRHVAIKQPLGYCSIDRNQDNSHCPIKRLLFLLQRCRCSRSGHTNAQGRQ